MFDIGLNTLPENRKRLFWILAKSFEQGQAINPKF